VNGFGFSFFVCFLVMGCQNFLRVDVVFSGGCCVFVLVFLYRMAWTCTGNLIIEKGTTGNGTREFREQAKLTFKNVVISPTYSPSSG